MRALRIVLLCIALGAVFAVGIVAGRHISPRPRREEPVAAAPTPRNAQELAHTLAQAEALYRQDDLCGAAAHYEAALRHAPTDADMRVRLAHIYLADHDLARALPHLKAAIQARPECAEAYMALARIFAGRGRGYGPQATALALKAAQLGYPVPEDFLQKLEKLEKQNARAKLEGRACPDHPMHGMDSARVAPHLLQRPAK